MRKLGATIVLILVIYGAWRMWRGPAEVADRGGRALFYGRVWVDHLPKTRTETFHVFGTVSSRHLGWFADRASWKGEWEMFQYKPRSDGQVDIVLPHSGQTLHATYRAWECDVEGFDYCLELAGARGPTKYYSRRGWERRDVADARMEDLELGAVTER